MSILALAVDGSVRLFVEAQLEEIEESLDGCAGSCTTVWMRARRGEARNERTISAGERTS